MVLSAAQMQEAVIKNLPEKTGKSLNEWISIAQDFQLSKNNDIVKKLKTEYGLGHVQAQTIAWRSSGEKPYVATKGYEEAIFKNTFELYLKLKNLIVKVSDEIKVKPCKTYIPFYRKNQFAIITEKKGELILGLNLIDKEYPELKQVDKLGGSERINKMLVVKDNDFKKIKKYIQTAFQNN
jgi:predicted transport protein